MDSLIDKLSDDLKPVQRTWNPFCCSSLWVFVTSGVIAAAVSYFGMRHDIMQRLGETEFLFEMILVVAMGLSAMVCTFFMRIPDMRGAGWLIPIPLTLLAMFSTFLLVRVITADMPMPEFHFHHCMAYGLLIAIAPGIFMFLMVMKGCTTRPYTMALMNGLALASVAYLTLRLTCPGDNIGHVLYTHIFPFILVGIIFGFLARRLYRW